MTDELFLKLESESVLITSLSRQADHFRLGYANWKRQNGDKAWPSPKIFSWTEWLKIAAEELLWSGYVGRKDVKNLLTPLQERTVWEQVIRLHVKDNLLHLPSTTETAKAAWQLIHAWRLPYPHTVKLPSEDVKAFSTWVETYTKRCNSASWTDYARLPEALKIALRDNKLAVAENIILAGFLELTPQQHELIAELKDKGAQIDFYQAEDYDSVVRAYSYSNLDEEIKAIAKWCRQLIEKDPKISIGVVVPSLKNIQADIEYHFRKTLYPCSIFSKDDYVNTSYQFSGGEQLSDSQIAEMAINLLELIKGEFTLDNISQILRSPYYSNGHNGMIERLKLDAWLRQQGVLDFTVSSFLRLLKSYERKNLDITKPSVFEKALENVSDLKSSKHTPSKWAQLFTAYLENFGWPTKDIGLKQQKQADVFRSCLTEFATLGFVHSEMHYGLAFKILRGIYQTKRLQGNPIFTPIQIMDFKEAFDLNFDYLWLAQLSAKELPESRKINPLIPFSWQNQNNISKSSPELCLQDVQKRLSHLKKAAKEVCISFTKESDSDAQSALLDEFNFEHQETSTVYQDSHNSFWVDETYGTEYLSEGTVGTSLFKYQSECPFKAYAKIRLLPKVIEKNTYGLTALERGHLLHRVLEQVWKRIENSETLNAAFDNEYLEMLLWETVDKVISSFEQNLNYPLSIRLKSIEKKRLTKLTFAWLALESQRKKFTVKSTEKEVFVDINGLQVKGYVDRIDTIDDLGFAIIDYKSGIQNSSSWFGDRPDEPQMPIYALAEGNKVIAVVYANLKPADQSFNGISQEKDIFPGIKAYDELSAFKRRDKSWAELLPYWREQMNVLSESFIQGLAIPDPKKGSQTCQYCELQSLCRLHANPLEI